MSQLVPSLTVRGTVYRVPLTSGYWYRHTISTVWLNLGLSISAATYQVYSAVWDVCLLCPLSPSCDQEPEQSDQDSNADCGADGYASDGAFTQTTTGG